jgi:hypothetical protein
VGSQRTEGERVSDVARILTEQGGTRCAKASAPECEQHGCSRRLSRKGAGASIPHAYGRKACLERQVTLLQAAGVLPDGPAHGSFIAQRAGVEPKHGRHGAAAIIWRLPSAVLHLCQRRGRPNFCTALHQSQHARCNTRVAGGTLERA